MRNRILRYILVLLSVAIGSQGHRLSLSQVVRLPHPALTTDKIAQTFHERLNMFRNKDPSPPDFLFNHQPHRFRSREPDEELLKLEQELRKRNLIHSPEVQWLIQKTALCSCASSNWAKDKLKLILEAERIHDMRTGDLFRPLAPKELLIQGDLHLCNQVDGIPWMIPINTLTRGMLLTGPQGGGKTRLLISVCR